MTTHTPAKLPTSIDAYLGVKDVLRLREVAPIVGVRRSFTHASLHRLGIPHIHSEGPHTDAEIDTVRGGLVPVKALAKWLEGAA